jgi:hypothetical protein
MKNFEESLRRLNAPDLPAGTFRHKLRRDLNAAQAEQSLRRWRGACLAACGLCVVLAVVLTGFVTAPEVPAETLFANSEISVDNDREFVEAYYARQGSGVRVQSVDAERLVAIREFTLSDGQRMVVYTEADEGDGTRSVAPLDGDLPMLASQAEITF